MTVTIEVINQGAFNLLQNMESQGLIHVKTSVSRNPKKTEQKKKHSNRWLRGIHKNLPGASVDEFLANCRADKEKELAIEKRQEDKRACDD